MVLNPKSLAQNVMVFEKADLINLMSAIGMSLSVTAL